MVSRPRMGGVDCSKCGKLLGSETQDRGETQVDGLELEAYRVAGEGCDLASDEELTEPSRGRAQDR